MRMSCNGCRVLRKGCSEDCTLRPSLQWINSTDAQANATLFLAKFYGRAGLLNLINAGPTHLRAEVFRSLLHEACGRIINPVYGSAGLMSSGEWPRCQAAVEAVLEGAPLDDSCRRARGRKGRKGRASLVSDELVSAEPEAKFTITGLECDLEGHYGSRSAPSHDAWSVEAGLMNWDEHPPVHGLERETRPSEIGVELTLGRDPVMQTYLYGDTEQGQNWR